MSDRFITLKTEEKVEDCQRRLRETADRKRDDISYLYVVDDETRLVGVVPLRELVFAKPTSSVEEVMDRDIKFLRVDDDQEAVARRFENYGYMGLPVLDKGGAMVGVVNASEAFEVAQEEATEDMQLMVGLSGEERSSTPWSTSITRRLPWLCVNLLTAFMAAVVVGYFESTIDALPVLAIFLGVIAGQGGNAGMQTLTVVIRDLALGELEPGEGRKVLFKEVLLGVINGIAIGLIVGAIGWFWKGQPGDWNRGGRVDVAEHGGRGHVRRFDSLWSQGFANRSGACFEHFSHDHHRHRRVLHLPRLGDEIYPEGILMLQIYEMLHSPYCIPITMMLKAAGKGV